MEAFEIDYVYRQSEEDDLEALLAHLQDDVGGKRKPYFSRKGAIDLVSFLEIVIAFTTRITLKSLVQKYLDGLLNIDALKKLGEEHRKQITEWFIRLESELQRLIEVVQSNLTLIHTSFTFQRQECPRHNKSRWANCLSMG